MSASRADLNTARIVWLVFALPALAAEEILSFDSFVEVEGNGDFLVTETIRVRSEGDAIRRLDTLAHRGDAAVLQQQAAAIDAVSRSGKDRRVSNDGGLGRKGLVCGWKGIRKEGAGFSGLG